MTTRDGLGEVSDHSLSMAMTAGSTLSATAGPPAISNATSTIAKRRTPTSPDEPLETPWPKFTKQPTPRKGAQGRKVEVRVVFLESVTYLPAPPARKRRQRAHDGSHSAFWAGRASLSGLSRPGPGRKQTSWRPFKSRAVSAPFVRFPVLNLIQRVSNRPGFAALSEGSISH